MTRTPTGASAGQLTALALMTAAVLGYEVLLTRAVAIQHWHHLTAVVVAVALLGLGCAGSLAAAFSASVRRRERGLMAAAALATAVAIPLSLMAAQQVPLNMLALPWYGAPQAGWLLLYALCYMLPFFCGAVFITLAFMRWADAIGRCYAADLAGSAVGVVLVLAWLDGKLLPETTLASAFRLSAGLPVLAFVLLEKVSLKRVTVAVVTLACLGLVFSTPGTAVGPSEFKSLPVQLAERHAKVLWQRDTTQSRLTLVESPGQHRAPGLSIRSLREAPRQWQVYRDGNGAVPLLLEADQGRYRAFFDEVMAGAAFLAAPDRPRVLLLTDSPSWHGWNAHWHQAASITLVAPDRDMADLLAGEPFPDRYFMPPDVRVAVMPPRRFLQAAQHAFDLIMADAGASPVGSAATRVQFALTREAIDLMLARLTPDGILAVTGRVMPLPRDTLRLVHSIAEVLRERRLTPSDHIVVVRDWQNLLVLVSPRPFVATRRDALSAWCGKWAFDRVAMPGLEAREANRFHQKPEALYYQAVRRLLSGDPADFVAAYPFDLSVTDDDRPFFYHFFRWGHWQDVRERLGRPWVLYVGWGYLLAVLSFTVLTPTAALLIVAPLTAPSLRRQIAHGRGAILCYFGAIGLGFMFIEMALIQKARLLMNSPTNAFALVVVAMLLGAGAGSLWSGRATNASRRWRAPLAIAVLGLTAPVLIDGLAAGPGDGAHGLKLAALVLFLLVLAFPMGTMLPRGIARIRRRGSGAVAWAWGINGFCSVLGALAAPLVAIEIGILGVAGWAAAFYLAAGGLFRRLSAF